jgi:hypothetical protein
MKKVISTALFGTKYSHYLAAFVRGTLNLFPREEGWEIRIFIDDVVANNQYGEFLYYLEERDLVETQRMGSAEYTKAMLWRMVPVFDPNVDYVFCRDIDAAPMPRDRACCEQFIASDAVVHTIHDHNAHLGIMGGLCGFKAPEFRKQTGIDSMDMLYLIANQSNEQWAKHGTDQDVLNRLLLAFDGPELLEHRYNGWFNGPDAFEARAVGSFPHACKYTSVPVPDKGPEWAMPGGMNHPLSRYMSRADRLGAHLGCAGYDHEAASKFWDEEGDPEIARLIKECE